MNKSTDDGEALAVSTMAACSTSVLMETGRGAPPGRRNGRYLHGMKRSPEGWVVSETQHDRHEDDADWKTAQRLRTIAGG